MLRITTKQRQNWRQLAEEYGFKFHTMYGQTYWDESAYYQFTLEQIERDLESPTEELHQMCLEVVDKVVNDEALLQLFRIPEQHWQFVADSWHGQDPSLYSRLDLSYSGKGSAKLLENNADTPTSLYETGFWQWLWLQNKVDSGAISRGADQFNSLQEKLVQQCHLIAQHYQLDTLHFACCRDTEEDRGTVQYIQDCAKEAGLHSPFMFVEDIGLSDRGFFTDLEDHTIQAMFKLYPWEFMLNEEFGDHLNSAQVHWLEPPWKAILSNKALLPQLWKMFPGHPNLLPAWFEHEIHQANSQFLAKKIVKKPLFSREGANISIIENGVDMVSTQGPYGEEGYIYQEFTPMPQFDNNYTLIGSWLVDGQAAGISIREDKQSITQDLSRYLPHIIL